MSTQPGYTVLDLFTNEGRGTFPLAPTPRVNSEEKSFHHGLHTTYDDYAG